MAVKHVHIPSIGDVTLYKRRNSRSLRLSIAPNGEVRVSMPYWVPYKSGVIFAASKAAWIQTMRQQRHKYLQHGQAIGKAHHLYFQAADGQRVTSRTQQQTITTYLPPGYSNESPDAQRVARTACVKALRKEAEHLLPDRLRTLAHQGGFTYKNVKIKHLKSRWGSCTSAGEIALNLFLMELPWELVDYVLWHELTHTKVMRHGPPFWQELEHHVPHARRLSKQLHTHEPRL